MMRIRHALVVLLFLLSSVLACSKDDASANYDYRTLGSAANDLLSANKYFTLEIELSYMGAFSPTDSVVNHLRNFLETYLNKPGGVKIFPRQINNTDREEYNINDVVALEKSVRTRFTRTGTIAVHIMILDANFAEYNVLGNSYWNTSMAVYGRAIDRYSGGVTQVSTNHLFIALIEHEFGHLLGLVDQGTPMVNPHRDQDKGAHCNNPNCMMYHVIETVQANVPTIPILDNNCIADLRNNGGK